MTPSQAKELRQLIQQVQHTAVNAPKSINSYQLWVVASTQLDKFITSITGPNT